MSAKTITTCRLCWGPLDQNPLLLLPSTPPANAFVEKPVEQKKFRLEVLVCRRCSHVQLGTVVDPSVLFSDYHYASGTSPVFVKHFDDYAKVALNATNMCPSNVVIDIGGNDGTLLKKVREHYSTAHLVNVDPAQTFAASCRRDNIDYFNTFFSSNQAAILKEQFGPARLIFANNVFAHVDDLSDVMAGVRTLLHPDGLFMMEVQYLGAMLKGNMFDMIYHEHLSYHTFTPLNSFLNSLKLKTVNVEKVPTHGGSLRLFVAHEASTIVPSPTVDNLIKEESSQLVGLELKTRFNRLAHNIRGQTHRLRCLLDNIFSLQKTVAGYGAPAKATTFCYTFNLNRSDLPYIVDDAPLKQGKFSPGLHIPIVGPEELYRDKPDYVLILAWNFAEAIINKHQQLGAKFIVPFPQVEIT